MASHPSLSASPVQENLPSPAEKMGRNLQCWCRSGLKYKKCHLGREEQDPVTVFQIEAKYLAQFEIGYCSYPNGPTNVCSLRFTNAHTIQRKGGLAAIAEKGHVLTVRPTMGELIKTDVNPSPRKLGIGKASVFRGFCSKHDHATFKSVEGKSLALNKNSAFLLSYRAIAFERFKKEAQLRGAPGQRDADRGKPFWFQCQLQTQVAAMITGIQVGARDVNRWKEKFDDRLLSGSRDDFHFLGIRFNRVLPIVACCAFHPQFDLQGNLLQQLARDGVDYEHMALTVTAFEGHTIIVLGWIGSQDGPAQALKESFKKVTSDRKADALIRLLFIHTENLYLQPSWWNGLSTAKKNYAMALAKSGTTMRARSAGELSKDIKSFVTASILEMVDE